MSVMCSSEKVSASAVQTPIGLFRFVSRDLRPQKNKIALKINVLSYGILRWWTIITCRPRFLPLYLFSWRYLWGSMDFSLTFKTTVPVAFFPFVSVWWAKIQSLVDLLEELMKIVTYMFAKPISLETGGFLVTRGHIPALLLGHIPLPAHPQCFAGQVRTQVQLCARVSSPGIHLPVSPAETPCPDS